MTEERRLNRRGRRRVRQHDVKPARGQLARECLRGQVLPATDQHRGLNGKHGCQQALHHCARHGAPDADHESRLFTLLAATAHRRDQRLAGGKDPVGEVVDLATRRREHQPAPLALQQFVAQHIFQQMDLRGDRRRRETQLGAGTRDAAFLGNFPEILQMVIVEPVHAERLTRRKRPPEGRTGPPRGPTRQDPVPRNGTSCGARRAPSARDSP